MMHEGVSLLLSTPLVSTDLSSPEIVAAQGGLVSVGSSYVTYIDKKGQVRDFRFILRVHVQKLERKKKNFIRFCILCSIFHFFLRSYSAQNPMKRTYTYFLREPLY